MAIAITTMWQSWCPVIRDFADAIQAVKDLGHHVEVALFEPGGSRRLREVADRVIPIDAGFLEGCWI